jgi:hypothetical protein
MWNVQGEVVPAQVVVPLFWGPALQAPLQPAKTELAFGVTVIVPC